MRSCRGSSSRGERPLEAIRRSRITPARGRPYIRSPSQNCLGWQARSNGLAYRAGVFAQTCRAWLVRHRFTRPYRPQTNGKAERFIHTLLREWAYRMPCGTSHAHTTALRPYLRFYNHRRPHASLGRRSPRMRFREAV